MDDRGAGFVVAATGVEVNEEERECFVVSAGVEFVAACEVGEGGA